MRQMLSPQEAQQAVLGTVRPLHTETLTLEAAQGRTLARDILSPFSLPPFANSAMDGYAVHAADVASATSDSPITLPVRAQIAAGEVPTQPLEKGTAARIMTGAPVPLGADCVVMREDTHESETSVTILASAAVGQSIRRAGSDIARDEVALHRSTRLRAAEWGLLAALGQDSVEVFATPRVALLVTGAELAELGTPLQPGQIYDANSWTLRGLTQECGAQLVRLVRCGDDPREFEAALRQCARDCDVIITSGGVSMGDFDPVRDVLPRVAEVVFWKIAMKPGKPVMFAKFTTEEDRTIPVFGLPGNPVSVMVAWELLVRPTLLKMGGRTHLWRTQIPVRVNAPLRSPAGREEYARVWVEPSMQGGWIAQLTGDQGSGRLTTMTRANALLRIPAEVEAVAAGDVLPALLTDLSDTLNDKLAAV